MNNQEQAPFWMAESFAPVVEETTEMDLQVTGSIPSELNGRYFRMAQTLKRMLAQIGFLAKG